MMIVDDENISIKDLLEYLDDLIRSKKKENSALRNLLSNIDDKNLLIKVIKGSENR